MMGRMLIVVILLCVEGVQEVATDTPTEYDGDQTIGDCINTLISHGDSLTCSLFRPYLKCLIKVTKFYKFPPGDQIYKTVQKELNPVLRAWGLNCSFDIGAISAKVAMEQNGRTDPTAENDGIHTAGDCINTIIGHGANLTCSVFRPYVKCLIKVRKLYKYQSGGSQYTTMNNELNFILRAVGLVCQFHIRAISAEVAMEQNSKTNRTTTVSHVSLADYDGDKTVQDCANTFVKLISQDVSSPRCSIFRSYVKCVVRVSGLYKYKLEDSHYTDLNNQLNALLQKTSLNCNVDLGKISAEVAKEQNTRNSDPGFNTSSPGMLLLLLPWICLYFFQF